MVFKPRTQLLHCYFFLSYLAVMTLCTGCLDKATLADPLTVIFCLLTLTSYSLAYLIPAFSITMACNHLLGLLKKKATLFGTFTIAVLAISTTSGTLIALYADQQIYHLFGFHFNSFVVNLITTSGGISSMGGSGEANITYGLIGASFVALQTGFYLLVGYLNRRLVRAI